MEPMPAQGVKLLEWQPYGYHGQYLKAAAFGVDDFYRIDGSPEDWMLHLPRERSYIEIPGYVTRADAQAAAWADYIARVRAAQDEAEVAPVAFTSLAAIKAVAEGRTAWMFPLREGDDPSMAIPLYAAPAAQLAPEPVAWAALYAGGGLASAGPVRTHYRTVPLYLHPAPAAPDGTEVAMAECQAFSVGYEAGEKATAGSEELAKLRTEVERLRAEREDADQSLVDRYRDPKSGRFDFPGDVAKIVRSLDDATVAAARSDAEIARLREALQAELAFAEGVAAEIDIDADETTFTVRVMPEGREVATRTWADVHAASRAALSAEKKGN